MKKLVTFKLKGGDLPDGREWQLNVEFDYTGCPPEVMAERLTGGMSDRVWLQSVYRKYKPDVLDKMVGQTQRVHWSNMRTGKVTPSLKDQMLSASLEQFVEIMVNEYGMDEDEATRLYNKKHGIAE